MKKSNTILIWGIATGLVSTIFYQILYSVGQEDSGLRWLNLIILFLGLFIGTIQYRDKKNEGYMTFGEGFKVGFFMVLIITLLSTIATIVDIQLHPDFIDKILAQSRDSMINKGMTDEQIQAGMKMAKIFTTTPILILTTIISGLLGGAIFSLITAGLSTRKKPIFDDSNEMSGSDTPQA